MQSDQTARLYDLFYDGKTDDANFYAGLAQEEGGVVCEMGAGSGRVTARIAAVGVGIVGVDISQPMLDRMKTRLANEPERVGRRVQLAHGDMRLWGPDEAFSQVFFPFRSFQCNLSSADRHRTLENAWRILRPNGRLAMNLFHPSHKLMRRYMGEHEGAWHDDGEVHLVEGALLRRSLQVRFDTLNKRLHARYRWYEGENFTEESLEMGYVYRDELLLHLERVGFAVEQVWGDFSRGPLEREDQEMVVVARRRG